MTIIMTSAVIRRPIEEVFAFLTDARNNPKWQTSSGLQKTQQVPDGPVGVGTRITEVWKFIGRETESISEVTEYEPNRKYTRSALAGDSSPIKRGDLIFEAVPEGTKLTWNADIQASGIFAIAEPLLASTMKKGIEANLAEVKALLEDHVTANA